jgi:hypothetical protein
MDRLVVIAEPSEAVQNPGILVPLSCSVHKLLEHSVTINIC